MKLKLNFFKEKVVINFFTPKLLKRSMRSLLLKGDKTIGDRSNFFDIAAAVTIDEMLLKTF